jgi:predicted dehydrogenase
MTATIILEFGDGSFGSIRYLGNGHRSLSKERLEVFCGGRVLQLDNFRKLRGFGWPGFSRMRLWRQNKGNAALAAAFVNAVEHNAPSPVFFGEYVEITLATLAAVDSMRAESFRRKCGPRCFLGATGRRRAGGADCPSCLRCLQDRLLNGPVGGD